MLSVNATVCGWVKTVTFTNNINNRNMNNLKNGSHRIEKDMLKSIVGETILTNFIKSEELGLTSYNYEYCDVKAHVIEEYPIPISVGKNKVVDNNVKTRYLDLVYILCPGDSAIFRK